MADEKGMQQQRVQSGLDWYEIEVEGQFSSGWFNWLEEWEITPLPSGNTLLSGQVVDQPALHGLFASIRDMNIKIVSLKKCTHSQPDGTHGMDKQDLKKQAI